MSCEDQLDDALRSHLRAVADAAPAPAPFPGGQSRTGSEPAWWRRPLLPAAALVAAVVAAGALWLTLGGDDGEEIVAGPDEPASGTVLVMHERVELQFTWDLDCEVLPNGLGPSPVDVTVETWWSSEDQLLRQRWEYEDGTFRDTVLGGDPWSPSEGHAVSRTGGEVAFGCGGTAMVREPGDGELFMLNPVRTPAAEQLVDERIAYGAEVVPGQWEDRLGNPAERYLAYGQGTVSGPDGAPVSATETMEWFLDPDTGQVRERRFDVVYDPLGTVSWTAVLVAADQIEVPVELFQPDWLDEPVERDADGPTVTTVVEASDQSTTTLFGVDPPGTTTLMGGDAGECDLDDLPDLTPAVPPGFDGPFPGLGTTTAEAVCARKWEGIDPWIHLNQLRGTSAFGFTPDGTVGGYRWGVIHEGWVLEHTGDTAWTVYAYGIDDEAFDRFVDDVIAEHPDGR